MAPGLYFNRELSWLKFNERVLEEARCIDTPLYERLRFLAIFAANLDEFYMVRIGSLMDQSLLSNHIKENKTGMHPDEQIRAANLAVQQLYPMRDEAYWDIMQGLSNSAFTHTSFAEMDAVERRFVKAYFDLEVLPLLSPLIIDIKHPFPHLENRQIYIGVRLKSKDKPLYGIIPLPREMERVYFVPGGRSIFLLMEDIVLHYANTAFDIYHVEEKAIFRVTRNADIAFDESLFDEEQEYRIQMQELLKKRRKLSPVRMEASGEASEDLAAFFLDKLMLSRESYLQCKAPLDMSFVSRLEEHIPSEVKETLLYLSLKPQWPAALAHMPITPQLMRKDVLLIYPYHSMRPVIDMIREAAEDARVVSIRMTIYRIGNQSQIIQSLCAAAEQGKEVVIIVELRARFDEQNNINWADRLEEAGCRIIYGIGDYKIHSKVVLITRRVHGKLQHVVNIATGNFNEATAKVYSDLSFFTSDPVLCDDAVLFFRNMEIGNLHGNYRKLLVAPSALKSRILNLISQEIGKAVEGKPACIVAKMNSLTDKDIIDSFIAAGQAGVRITLIIRGICCLKPGVAGYTDHITVRSIVGRFLEHARIFRFGEGEEAEFYIGSADMMTRNTERRVEVLAPIENAKLAAQLNDMLELQMRDNVKARELGEDGQYRFLQNQDENLDSQIFMYEQAYQAAKNNQIQEQERSIAKKIFQWIQRFHKALDRGQKVNKPNI